MLVALQFAAFLVLILVLFGHMSTRLTKQEERIRELTDCLSTHKRHLRDKFAGVRFPHATESQIEAAAHGWSIFEERPPEVVTTDSLKAELLPYKTLLAHLKLRWVPRHDEAVPGKLEKVKDLDS